MTAHDPALVAQAWHDVTCPEGPNCRDRLLHSAAQPLAYTGVLARFLDRLAELEAASLTSTGARAGCPALARLREYAGDGTCLGDDVEAVLAELDEARRGRDEARSDLERARRHLMVWCTGYRETVSATRLERGQLIALAVAVENYLSGGMSTAGLRELYAAREALNRGKT